MNNKNLFIKWSTQLYIGWVLFIALLTLLPGSVFPGISWNFFEIDKLIHITVFSVLVFLGSTVFHRSMPDKIWKAILLSFLLASLYGTILEFTQALVPERSFDYADLVANYFGAIIGTVAYRLVYNFL